jgi:LmbE family N-acetylglucosaminyl deacetylase
MLICATKGEVGEISDPNLASPETLSQVRQKELEEACRIIGIQHLEFLNYRDSGMQGTAENSDPRALIQSDTAEFQAKIVTLIRRFQPDIVITFEPFGWYGHPDHIFVSKWVTAAFPLAADPNVFPEAGQPWQPQRLFHSVLPISKFRDMIEKAIQAGLMENAGLGENIPMEQQLATEARVTHIFDQRHNFETIMTAMMAHRTQFGPNNLFSNIPTETLKDVTGKDYFIQVIPNPDLVDSPLTDLWS